jgi:hypothetical protein
VYDEALEDVAGGKDALDHADAIPLAVIHRRSVLQCEVGDLSSELLYRHLVGLAEALVVRIIDVVDRPTADPQKRLILTR